MLYLIVHVQGNFNGLWLLSFTIKGFSAGWAIFHWRLFSSLKIRLQLMGEVINHCSIKIGWAPVGDCACECFCITKAFKLVCFRLFDQILDHQLLNSHFLDHLSSFWFGCSIESFTLLNIDSFFFSFVKSESQTAFPIHSNAQCFIEMHCLL